MKTLVSKKDVTLMDLTSQIQELNSECKENAGIYFRNKKQGFFVTKIAIDTCSCCGENYPVLYGEEL
jgi:hypothetical protein